MDGPILVGREALVEALREVAAGQRSVEDATARLAESGSRPLGHTTVDVDRERRTGLPEVVFGAGKTPAQIVEIARVLHGEGQRVLVTRIDPAAVGEVQAALADVPVEHDPVARCLHVATRPVEIRGQGVVLVVSAGTSDAPVAAEATFTARVLGNRVETLNDVGVAGVHRLLNRSDRLRQAAVIIVCAGMEGALPSVVAGLVGRPVIAVPTSIGYGASFGGVAALLGMLCSCASGVTVVNIDNGFGAAYAATLMNRPVS